VKERVLDAYEQDMVTAVFGGLGPEVGADRQFLRRVAAENLYVCQRHKHSLVLKESVAVEIRNKTTGHANVIVVCAAAFDDAHTQSVLAGASVNIEVTVYDGRKLFANAKPNPEAGNRASEGLR
jgi:hypothetical protein